MLLWSIPQTPSYMPAGVDSATPPPSNHHSNVLLHFINEPPLWFFYWSMYVTYSMMICLINIFFITTGWLNSLKPHPVSSAISVSALSVSSACLHSLLTVKHSTALQCQFIAYWHVTLATTFHKLLLRRVTVGREQNRHVMRWPLCLVQIQTNSSSASGQHTEEFSHQLLAILHWKTFIIQRYFNQCKKKKKKKLPPTMCVSVGPCAKRCMHINSHEVEDTVLFFPLCQLSVSAPLR